MGHQEFWVWALFAAVLLVCGTGIGIWLSSRWRRLQGSWRRERGKEGEEKAETFLEANGFAIVERQARASVEYDVDGERESAEVYADFIAEKEGVEYVVEVKTGAEAADPGYAPTRRQLLEYSLAFENPNLILVDMETQQEHRVEFPGLEERRRTGLRWLPWEWVLGMFAAGLACGIWVMWHRP